MEAMIARLGDPEIRERIRQEVEAPTNGQSLWSGSAGTTF